MQTFKLIGALTVVLAFSALSVATSSATEKLWKLLPGSSGETFTGKSGKVIFSGKFGTIACAKSTIILANASLLEEGSTEKKDATLALALIDFDECVVAGISINSVGDPAKTVLVHAEIHTCIISPGDFSLLLKLLQVHVELPAVKLLILIRGTLIGLLEGKEGTKQLIFGLKINAPEKKQEFLKCEGGGLDLLEEADDSQPFEAAAKEFSGLSLTFDGTKDKEGEEPMV